MHTSLYEKIKQFMKQQLLPFIGIVLLFVVLTIKLPWSVYAPGGLINVGQRLSTKETDAYYLTYVTFIEGTLPTLLLGAIFPTWDIVSNADITLEGEDLEVMNKRDKLYMQEAISNATYVGYMKAVGNVLVQCEHGYITYLLENTDLPFQVGDEIIMYDHIAYQSREALTNYIETKEVGDTILFEIKRGTKEMEVTATTKEIDGVTKLGIGITSIFDYEDIEITYSAKSSESGSSGGLMMSLAIYDALTEEDLGGNRKISGTGTISQDGSVGAISGVKYKLAGAVKKKADIFLVPEENYEEALKEKEEHHYTIDIIKATTFDQVIADLKS